MSERETVIPTCFRCGRSAEEIGEYQDAARDENAIYRPVQKITPTEWMMREEGTYNPDSNRFCCTKCYVEIGAPSAPYPGWKAP